MGARCAFTLIELLVVVAIIAMLVAILLPVLGRARAQGRSVVCRKNLQQAGAAIVMYVIQNNEYIPRGTPDANQPDWITLTLKTLGYRWQQLHGKTMQESTPVNRHPVFRCPERQLTLSTHFSGEALLDYVSNSIRHNGEPWNPPANALMRINIWPRASSTVYLADAATEQENASELIVDAAGRKVCNLLHGRRSYMLHEFDFWAPKHLPVDPATTPKVPVDKRNQMRISQKLHMGNSANCLFVDGHVEGVKYQGMSLQRWLLLVGVQPKIAKKANTLSWE